MAACVACSALLPAGACFCPACGAKIEVTETTIVTDELKSAQIEKTHHRVGSSTQEGRYLPEGKLLTPHYKILELLGEGGMGAVYRGRDLVHERDVAIKVLHSNLRGDEGIRKRFQREARVTMGWFHPNIVSVYDYLDLEHASAIVMELIQGPSLHKHLEAWGGKMPFGEIKQLFTEILEPLSLAHKVGIVHRDLKPDNILLSTTDKKYTPKLVDFGIAKVVEGTRYTMTGALLGTCRYMSPEQIKSADEVDLRSDIYALGIVLYQLVTGRVPFDYSSHYQTMIAHISDVPESPKNYRPDIGPELEQLIHDMLAKLPSDRPQSCSEVAARLQLAIGDTVDTTIDFGPSDDLPKKLITEDKTNSMCLISGGTFLLGPHPHREVMLGTFYIDETPVTNEQFAYFLEVTGYKPEDVESGRFLLHWRQGLIPGELRTHPVVFVSLYDAMAYASWCGKRLPTEAEWEKAARGIDGFKYPWGRESPSVEHANFGRKHMGTTDVRAFPGGVSPFGIFDMAGNVWEWCQDVFDEDFYKKGPSINPRNTVAHSDSSFVVRGGAFLYDRSSLKTYTRASFKPMTRVNTLGFRCARNVE